MESIVLEYAHSPVRIDSTRIDLVCKFTHLSFEVPFTADENDVEPHGRDIYQRAANGEFGPVGEQNG